MSKFISIIIPTRNRAFSLKETLESLLVQEKTPVFDYEIIVVDNNSIDRTRQIVESYIDKFNGKLRYIFESKQGQAYAMNRGIEHSKGSIVAFIDDDEIAYRDWIKKIYESFDLLKADCIGGRYIPQYQTELPEWYDESLYTIFHNGKFGNKTKRLNQEKQEILGSGGNLVVLKSVFDKYGKFNTDFTRSHDCEFTHRILNKGAKIFYCPEIIIYHSIPKNRLTKEHFRYRYNLSGVSYARIKKKKYNSRHKLLNVPFWILHDFILNVVRSFIFFFKGDLKKSFYYRVQSFILYGNMHYFNPQIFKLKKNSKFLTIFHSSLSKAGGLERYYIKFAQYFKDKTVVIAPIMDKKQNSIYKDIGINRRRIIFKEPSNRLAKYIVTIFERINLILITLPIIMKEKTKKIILGSIWLGWLGYFFKRTLGLKYFIFAHGTEFFRLKHKYLSARHVKYLNNAQKIIVNSTFTKQLGIECDVKGDRLEIIHPGCDLQEELVASNNGHILLGVGRLTKRKGFESVINALPIVLRKYPDLQYIIVGNGDERRRLEDLVIRNKLNNNVVFKGRVEHRELLSLYSSCDFFILTNYIDDQSLDVEGFGMVFLEANSFGKAVIGGNNGGAIDAILEGKTGLLVNPKDEKDIAKKILYLLDNPKLRKEMGRRGFERARKEFSWDVTFSKIEKVLGQ